MNPRKKRMKGMTKKQQKLLNIKAMAEKSPEKKT